MNCEELSLSGFVKEMQDAIMGKKAADCFRRTGREWKL